MKITFGEEDIQIYDFNELEAYKIARKMERDGIFYYKKLLEEVKAPIIKEAVDFLLEEEKRHLSLFEEKIEALGGDEGDEESLVDVTESKVLNVIRSPQRLASVLCNEKEAIKVGISLEKRSIAFYNALLHNTEDPSGKKAIEDILQEEKTHLETFQGLL